MHQDVVCASQIEGRCNNYIGSVWVMTVVCASQIEGRCNKHLKYLQL